MIARRGILGDIFSGVTGGNIGGGDAKGEDSGGAGGAGGGFLSNIAGKFLNLTGPALSGAAFFGGVGAGEGAAQGLGLGSVNASMSTGAQVAEANGMEKKGLNGPIESAAMGLTATALKTAMAGNKMQISDLGPGVQSLGVGIGNGAAMGLNLTQQNLAPAASDNSSGLAGVLGNFGFGASNSLTKNVNLGGLMGSGMAASIGAAALNAGSGLGAGAVSGLKLTEKDVQPPPLNSSTDIAGIAGMFAFGLGKSTAGAVNLGGLTKRASGDGGFAKYVGPAAAGLGKGLGSGAAVGLGLQPDQPAASEFALPDGSIDIVGVTQGFASGLASRFLADGTAKKLAGSIMGTGNGSAGTGKGLTANLNIQRVASGLARGLVTGAGDGVEAMGGINAIINGTSKSAAVPVEDSKSDFDDSVNGAALGFGQGLGNSAVATVQRLLEGKEPSSPVSQLRRRSVSESSALVARQAQNGTGPASDGGLDLSRLLNAESVSKILQKGVDIISCEGVGGLALLLRGLRESGALSLGSGAANNPVVQSFIPPGEIRLTNGRNKFDINAKQAATALSGSLLDAANNISVNNTSLTTFVVLLVVHGNNTSSALAFKSCFVANFALVFFAIAALGVMLPLALMFQSTHNILQMIDMAHLFPTWLIKAVKATWIVGILPSAILTLVFGVLSAPKSGHFQTAHGVSSSQSTSLGKPR